MSPESVALLKAVVEILQALGSWPNWAVLAFLGLIVLFGPLGCIVHLWRKDIAAVNQIVREYRDDTNRILNKLGDYMKETRRMYENNAELVEDRAKDFKTLRQVVEDQQGLTVNMVKTLATLEASIRANQFCPAARVEKKMVEVRG